MLLIYMTELFSNSLIILQHNREEGFTSLLTSSLLFWLRRYIKRLRNTSNFVQNSLWHVIFSTLFWCLDIPIHCFSCVWYVSSKAFLCIAPESSPFSDAPIEFNTGNQHHRIHHCQCPCRRLDRGPSIRFQTDKPSGVIISPWNNRILLNP